MWWLSIDLPVLSDLAGLVGTWDSSVETMWFEHMFAKSDLACCSALHLSSVKLLSSPIHLALRCFYSVKLF